jgi:glycosyltransferase involved in cell wall biosynthesis
LLSVGRLAEQKDYATLIDAFALAAHRQSEWDLRIVGEGELRSTLEERINRLGMTGRVFLPGATKDICAEYEAAQLFVLPSLYESQGLALVEALSHGLPAVGFAACPGVNQLIRPGINGVLASGSDRVRSLAEVLEPLMADVQARERLVTPEAELPEEFGPESILDRWEQVLRQCKGADARVL